jgi:hypothetical protein
MDAVMKFLQVIDAQGLGYILDVSKISAMKYEPIGGGRLIFKIDYDGHLFDLKMDVVDAEDLINFLGDVFKIDSRS